MFNKSCKNNPIFFHTPWKIGIPFLNSCSISNLTNKNHTISHDGDDSSRKPNYTQVSYTGISETRMTNHDYNRQIRNRSRTAVTCRVTSTSNNTKAVMTWYTSKPTSTLPLPGGVTGSTKNIKRISLIKTAGSMGYNNAKRGTVYAAQEVIAKLSKLYFEKENKQGNIQTGIHLKLRGMGRSRSVVSSELTKAGFTRLTVSDATKDAHNGCRRKAKRRI
jgi:ribosomal protein S11